MADGPYFVSYSRKDEWVVGPATRLLRAASVRVLRDIDIPPGSPWEEIIQQAIKGATVLIFWSKDAASSKWVRKEVGESAEHASVIIPVLLDDTPLPPGLASYQAIDARALRRRTNSLSIRKATTTFATILLMGLAVGSLNVWSPVSSVSQFSTWLAACAALVAALGGLTLWKSLRGPMLGRSASGKVTLRRLSVLVARRAAESA